MRRFLSALTTLMLTASLGAQTDSLSHPSDTVGIIYVEEGDSTQTEIVASPVFEKDFYRNMLLLRLPLQHHQNQPMQQASFVESGGSLPLYDLQAKGFVPSLLEGLRSGKLTARNPQRLSQNYTYFDLIYDLLALEGIDPETLERELKLESLGWEWLNMYLDLIVEEGFSQDQSRPFLRIRFIRLLYYNPNSPQGLHVLAIFPYDQLQDVLGELTYPMPNGGPFRLKLMEFLRFRKFYGQAFRVVDDPALFLPATPHTTESLRNRWPELWDH